MESLSNENVEIYAWTDSMIVLGWIKETSIGGNNSWLIELSQSPISFHHHVGITSLTRIVKIVAWISRFIKRSRGKHTGGTEFLTSAELHNALHLIIQNYQLYEFHEDIQFINQKGYVHPKSKISCLNPFLDEDILIKEENLPPGKWALGRIQDVHPGKDNYVRVVSLKTKGDNIIKRPVNKLVLLPTNEDTAQDQAIDQGNSSNPSPPSSCQQKRE
ncbi:hypothetical protein HF086_007247 [Spodoptera exigua]|uniref:DUF5641 domain-containing protein n=1 Tax=Spodoptera exigua TaxID=7107 RepID=A0A922MM53_SPOEX|nr:hypothetical protein HF086_007247 [Spodoptera exigua]